MAPNQMFLDPRQLTQHPTDEDIIRFAAGPSYNSNVRNDGTVGPILAAKQAEAATRQDQLPENAAPTITTTLPSLGGLAANEFSLPDLPTHRKSLRIRSRPPPSSTNAVVMSTATTGHSQLPGASARPPLQYQNANGLPPPDLQANMPAHAGTRASNSSFSGLAEPFTATQAAQGATDALIGGLSLATPPTPTRNPSNGSHQPLQGSIHATSTPPAPETPTGRAIRRVLDHYTGNGSLRPPLAHLLRSPAALGSPNYWEQELEGDTGLLLEQEASVDRSPTGWSGKSRRRGRARIERPVGYGGSVLRSEDPPFEDMMPRHDQQQCRLDPALHDGRCWTSDTGRQPQSVNQSIARWTLERKRAEAEEEGHAGGVGGTQAHDSDEDAPHESDDGEDWR